MTSDKPDGEVAFEKIVTDKSQVDYYTTKGMTRKAFGNGCQLNKGLWSVSIERES